MPEVQLFIPAEMIVCHQYFQDQKCTHDIQHHHHDWLRFDKKANTNIKADREYPGDEARINFPVQQNRITPQWNRKDN